MQLFEIAVVALVVVMSVVVVVVGAGVIAIVVVVVAARSSKMLSSTTFEYLSRAASPVLFCLSQAKASMAGRLGAEEPLVHRFLQVFGSRDSTQ